MALPTAVKRRSEQARRMVAERNGQPPVQSLQSVDGDYLDVGSSSSEPTGRAAQVAHVSADILATKDQAQQSKPEQATVRDDTRIPHVLSDEYMENDDTDAAGSSSVLKAPSHEDTVNNGTSTGESPNFIDEHDWKARYTALRTSRDDRIAVLEQDARQQKTTIDGLTRQLQSQSGKDSTAANRFELDDDTRASLGEDQARVFDQFNQSVEERFTRQQEERQQETQRTATTFESDLESLVPRWREINTDQRFLDWLNQSDEVMKMRRQDMLDSFVQSRDAGSVAALFRSFAGRSAHVQQRNGQAPSPELSATRAGSGMGAEENLVEVWDQSEVADFFKKKSRLYQTGKLKGELLNQVQAEEARIRKAMNEGRVDMTR